MNDAWKVLFLLTKSNKKQVTSCQH